MSTARLRSAMPTHLVLDPRIVDLRLSSSHHLDVKKKRPLLLCPFTPVQPVAATIPLDRSSYSSSSEDAMRPRPLVAILAGKPLIRVTPQRCYCYRLLRTAVSLCIIRLADSITLSPVSSLYLLSRTGLLLDSKTCAAASEIGQPASVGQAASALLVPSALEDLSPIHYQPRYFDSAVLVQSSAQRLQLVQRGALHVKDSKCFFAVEKGAPSERSVS